MHSSESEFVSHLLECLEPVGGVSAKRMFGGHGIFRGGVMFGLVADGILYLKVDDESRPEFESRGLAPFRYEGKDGRVAVMSYCQCPEDALDSPGAMLPWARLAIGASDRTRQPKPKKKAPPKKPRPRG